MSYYALFCLIRICSLLRVGYLIERLARRVEPVVDAEAELAPDAGGRRGPGIRRRRTRVDVVGYEPGVGIRDVLIPAPESDFQPYCNTGSDSDFSKTES